jgi:hypothetical protein
MLNIFFVRVICALIFIYCILFPFVSLISNKTFSPKISRPNLSKIEFYQHLVLIYIICITAPLAQLAKDESGVRTKLVVTAWVQFLQPPKHEACLLSITVVRK